MSTAARYAANTAVDDALYGEYAWQTDQLIDLINPTERTDMYLKTLNQYGTSPYQGTPWPLPTQAEDGTWVPGEWTPVIDELSLCHSGWHLTTPEHLRSHLAARIFEAEIHPDANVLEGDDKITVTQCRLVRELPDVLPRLREWALLCAEHVQHLDPSGEAERINRETRAKLGLS